MGAAIGTGSAGSRVILSRIQFAGLVTNQERETQRAARGRAGQQATANRPSRPSKRRHGVRASHTRGSMVAGARPLWRADLYALRQLRRCDPGPGQRVTLHGCVPSHGRPKPSQDKTGSRGHNLADGNPPKLSRTITHVGYCILCVHTQRTPVLVPHPAARVAVAVAVAASGAAVAVSDEGQATDSGSACSRRGFPAPSFA